MLGIGFDSGGTHTSYALKRPDGPVDVSGSEATASLADARHRSSHADAIDWITEVIEGQTDDEICVWIGAAGFSAATADDTAEQFRRPIEKLAARFEANNRHIEIYIANDAIALLKAPPLTGTGVAAIVGTGSVVLGAHPACTRGIVKRGGYEWVVSDEGAGVWMTLECIRMLISDINERGATDYHSVLLDRLCDFFRMPPELLQEMPVTHRALAKADFLARVVAQNRPDLKRVVASFVYPHLFDLVELQAGRPHDPIAAEILSKSVEIIAENIRIVSETLAAYTADEPNRRESLQVVVGGNIASNPLYAQRLRSQISVRCRYVSSVDTLGDASASLASLALETLRSNDRLKRTYARNFDPLHPVRKLL